MKRMIFILLLIWVLSTDVFAQGYPVPHTLNVQGVLRNVVGEVVTGNYQITFRLWTAQSGGTKIHEETATVGVIGGYFNVYLGPFVTNYFAQNKEVWLEIQIGTDPPLPRRPITSVGYAFMAERAKECENLLNAAPDLACANPPCVSSNEVDFNWAKGVTKGGAAADLQCESPSGCVHTADIVDAQVTSAKIADGTIQSVDLSSNLTLSGDTTTTNLLVKGGLYTGASISASTLRLTNAGALQNISTINMAGQLTNTVADGTAPFVISSKTKVANLNADLLDGLDSSYFLDAGNLNPSGGKVPISLLPIATTTTLGVVKVGVGLSIDGTGLLKNSGILSISATAPIQVTAGQSPTISITKAGTGSDGYLSSADWNTFNNKLSAVATRPQDPFVGNGTSSAPLGMTQASSTSNGWLSSVDWSAFNAKAPGSGSPNYIQNQIAAAQNASFWISGTGRANSNIQASAFVDNDNTTYLIDPNSSVVSAKLAGPVLVGTTTVTGGVSLDVVGGSIRTNKQLISTASTGAPLVVSSNVVVTNLNADLLDGKHGTDFAPVTGGSGYIQNQIASAQNASFWISGDGKVAGKMTAGSLCFGTDCKTSWGQVTGFWSPNGSNIYNNNSGYVGIGTTTPGSFLEVRAGSNIQNVFEITGQTSGDHSWFFGFNGNGNLVTQSNWDEWNIYLDRDNSGTNLDFFRIWRGAPPTGSPTKIFEVRGDGKTYHSGNMGILTENPKTRLQIGEPYVNVQNNWPTSAQQGVLIGQDTDNVFLGLIDEGANADRAAIVFGDDADDYMRILFNNPNAGLTELIRILPDGRTGFGVTSPGHKIDVAGNVNASQLCIAGDCRSNWASVGTNYWKLTGSSLSPVNSSGYNVVVGGDNAVYRLTIVGGGTVFGVDNTATFAAKNASGGYENYLWPRWSDNIMYLNYGSQGFHIRDNSSNTAMFMTADRRIGIGTTSPVGRLHIVGGTPSVPGLVITTSDVNNENHSIRIVGPAGTERAIGFFTDNTAEWWFGRDNTGDVATGIGFWRSGVGFPFVIRDSGFVGIGTTAPARRLHVADTIRAGIAGNSSANYAALEVVSAGANNPAQAVIAIQQATSEGDTIIFSDYEPNVEWNLYHENGPNQLQIGSGNSTNSLKSRTVYNRSGQARTSYVKHIFDMNNGNTFIGGNLGIGTTNPGYRLHNVGTTYSTDYYLENTSGSAGGVMRIDGYQNFLHLWSSTNTGVRIGNDPSGTWHQFDPNGNVGIGTGTTTPPYRLTVNGTTSTGDLRLTSTVFTDQMNRIIPFYIRGTGLNNNANRRVVIGNSVLVDNSARGLTLTIIRKSDMAHISSTNYDTYGSATASNNLATALAGMTRDYIGILTSYDAWETNVTASLRSQFERLGLFKAFVTSGTARRPYAAIFEGGSNLRSARVIEVLRNENANAQFAEIAGWFANGSFMTGDLPNALSNNMGTTTSVVVAENGMVGVNTSSPDKTLTVNGDLRVTGQICTPTGCGAGSYYWTASGNNLYPINLSYNVGLGTTGSGARLHVVAQGGYGSEPIRAQSNSTFFAAADANGVQRFAINNDGGPRLNFYGSDSGWFNFMSVDNAGSKSVSFPAGNVGVGTTGPAYKLDVNGDLATRGHWHWWATKNFYMHGAGDFSFDFDDGDGNDSWHVWDPVHGSIIFARNSGRVGIMTDPAYTFDVNGTVGVGNTYLKTSTLFFSDANHNWDSSMDTGGRASIQNSKDYNALMIVGRSGTSVGRRVGLWDYLTVNGHQDITGNLGVGSGFNSFDERLTVQGNIKMRGGYIYSDISPSTAGVLRVSGGQIAIQQVTSEGNTRIYADFPPYHSWGIYHRNSDNTIHFTRRDGSGFESWSEAGPGATTTTVSVAKITLDTGRADFYDVVNARAGICINNVCKNDWGQIGGYWTLSGSNLYPINIGYNVGIGTTSPQAKLHVEAGKIYVSKTGFPNPSSYTDADLVLGSNTTTRNGYGGTNGSNLMLRSSDKSTITFLDEGQNLSQISYQNLLFTIGENVGWGNANVYFPGRVGIGTSGPAHSLDVVGDAYIRQVGGSNNFIWFRSGSDANTAIELRSGSSGGTPYIDFANDASVDYDARLRLLGNGRLAFEGTLLGIGRDPGEALDVQGNIRAFGPIYSQSDPSYAQTYLRTWGLLGNGTIYIEPKGGSSLELTDQWSYSGPLNISFGITNWKRNDGAVTAWIDKNGNASFSGTVTIGNMNLQGEIVQREDGRLSWVGTWYNADNSWGANRFSTHARYTACENDNDCSGSYVDLILNNNQYRTVQMAHLDWSNTRYFDVYLSVNGGSTYAFLKRFYTYRASGNTSNPYTSSIYNIASNLPIGANVRIRVVAARGRMHWEGFNLLKYNVGDTKENNEYGLAPLYYDAQDLGYYVDPNSLSNFRYLHITTNDSWFPYTGNNWNYFRGNTYAFNAVWYDENNSSYYLDPSGTTRFNLLYTNGTRFYDSWPGDPNGFAQVANLGGHIYIGPDASKSDYVIFRYGGDNRIYFRLNGNVDTARPSFRTNGGYLVINPGTSDKNLYLNWDTGGNVQINGTLYAEFIYDRNNTGYYLDPAGTSRMNQINFTNLYYAGNTNYGFLGQNVYTDTVNTGVSGDPLEIQYYRCGDVKFFYGNCGGQTVLINGYAQSRVWYDIDDTGYWVDPRANSVSSNWSASFYGGIRFPDVTQDIPQRGIYWHGTSTDYAIFREGGGWSHPYPDLRIAFHTGIKLGAYYGYNGIRFYNNSDMVTQIFSIGDSDNNTRVKWNQLMEFRVHNSSGPPITCNASYTGAFYFDTNLKKLRVCDGSVWLDVTSSGGGGGQYCYNIGYTSGGPSGPCPTGKTQWCDSVPANQTSQTQALKACEACWGVGKCYYETADCAGPGYGPRPPGQYWCNDPYWGWTSGCSGGPGRVWKICWSWEWNQWGVWYLP